MKCSARWSTTTTPHAVTGIGLAGLDGGGPLSRRLIARVGFAVDVRPAGVEIDRFLPFWRPGRPLPELANAELRHRLRREPEHECDCQERDQKTGHYPLLSPWWNTKNITRRTIGTLNSAQIRTLTRN